MGNLKVAGLDIGSHNLTIDESSGTLLVDGEEVSGSGGGGISYVWANEAAKLATTGMKTNEQGLQQDTGIVYKYTGSAWVKYYVMSDSTVQKYYEGTSAPINSKLGDEWFKYNDGTLYKRVSDGVDAVWMSMNSLAGGGSGGVGTNYTTRNETLEANKTVRYPLNGVNSNYALHAFALKELPIGKDVLSLNTVLMGSGYYGVKIPRIDNIQLSFPSGASEPLKRMSAHNQYGQTISATNEYNASYAAWKMFSAGDTGTGIEDCWHSAATLTPSTPLIVTFTSPNVFSMASYKMVNRNGTSASPRAWKIEGRVGNSGNWELIHEVVNDTGNTPNLVRVFNIPEENRKACDQYRLVILKSNNEPYAVIARLIIYQETSKFMIEDGINKYRSTSTGYSLSYTPMTKHSEHNQVISATSEHNATYVAWKVLLAGNTTSDVTDCWASIAAPTALAPQIITIDFGQPKKIYSYSIVNRFGSITEVASPSSWSIEVRNNLLDDWVTIDNIQDDKDSNPLSVRNFSIAEEKRGEWRYFRIVIKDRNGTAPYTCISRLRIYGALIGEELELVPNVTTKNDITVKGTSSGVFITKQKLSTLSNPYIITDEPSAIKLTIDSEREYEYSNNVKIALAKTYIKFTTTEGGKYKFCYQEPAPDTP